MLIASTHIVMLMIFLETSGQPPVSGNSFLAMIPFADPVDLEIEGIIVDATQTKVGRDFYDLFYGNWNPDENLPKLSITISEKPYIGSASLVEVSIDENIIFQRFVQPRYDVLEENAKEAVQIALAFLENYELMQKQLQGEDLAGSGIY